MKDKIFIQTRTFLTCVIVYLWSLFVARKNPIFINLLDGWNVHLIVCVCTNYESHVPIMSQWSCFQVNYFHFKLNFFFLVYTSFSSAHHFSRLEWLSVHHTYCFDNAKSKLWIHRLQQIIALKKPSYSFCIHLKLAIWDYLTVTYVDAKFRNFGVEGLREPIIHADS